MSKEQIEIRVETSQIVETCKQAVEKIKLYRAEKRAALIEALIRPAKYKFFGLIKIQREISREEAIEIIDTSSFYDNDFTFRFNNDIKYIYRRYAVYYEDINALMLKLISYAPDSVDGSMLLPFETWNDICNISLWKV